MHICLASKYRLMEGSLRNKRDRFQGLHQELDDSLKALAMLSSHAGTTTSIPYTYELGDTLYGHATLPPAAERNVGLWLGAGVMLEYPLGEARQFLQGKREERAEELRKVEHDLDFIRAQITTTEVTLARLYNHLVRQNKK